MPITNRQDASDVDEFIERIFAADTADGRFDEIQSMFVAKLDFDLVFESEVGLERAPSGVTLPATARVVARLEDTHVVYVDLAGTGIDTNRVRKSEASEAARLIEGQLGGDLLLVFTNRGCDQLHFVLPSFEGRQPALRRMIVERDLPRRTAIQQLSNIYWEWDRTKNIRAALDSAFDVEAVTKRFFTEYKEVFDGAMEKVTGFGGDEKELDHKNLFVQTLFNRLMFVYFISRKGWLAFGGDKDYLNALWRSYESDADQSNFFVDRLRQLFFAGLNNPAARDLIGGNTALIGVIGDVPFLNGGLFDKSDLDDEPGVFVPDDAIEPILSQLFDRFNFTVMESTPLDVEVAVDPEMLGKVFEEMINERHESGAYYTPRPVVSFMCREALKGYLAGRDTGLADDVIAAFVDDRDTTRISLTEAQKVSRSLSEMTVVDPACGSGAYLLGMMQELVDLQSALYSDQLRADARSLYRQKLDIIERNLYGADNDHFAVNIAMLRLWLSLVIEYEGEHPEPLPNLDYKIVCGDSLLGGDPSSEGGADFYRHLTEQLDLRGTKASYMRATDVLEKQRLEREIDDAEYQIRETMGDATLPEGVVDWAIDFADVFAPNDGFDVVVANPPYVRQEKIGPTKPVLRKVYADSTVARSDLYCYFYVRGLQLLREGGMHVFVCSNSWLDVGYGAKLQEHLLKNARVDAVYESAVERQFSTAQINTIISVISRSHGGDDQRIRFVSLRDEFESAISDASKRREMVMSSHEIMESSLGTPDRNGRPKFVGDKWGAKYLRAPGIYRTLIAKGQGKFVRLGNVAVVRFGIKTGVNDFFYLSDDDMQCWQIEGKFLKRVMMSPQESRSIIVDPAKLKYQVFLCNKSKDELSGTRALNYIEHGELKEFHRRRSVTGRRRWWDLGELYPANAAINTLISSTARTFMAPKGLLFDQSAYTIEYSQASATQLCTTMNSTATQLMVNLGGRVNFGGGLLRMATYEVAALNVIDPMLLPRIDVALFNATDWDVLSPSAERKTIDNVVFDILTLTQGERDGVYEGVRELVENRMRRARSV